MKLKDVKETVADVEVTVDPEFQKVLPKFTEKRKAELREQIEGDGRFVDTIKLWGEYNTIIDGMTRFQIWCELPEDTKIPPPPVEWMDHKFESREAVKAWILSYQLTRRNLNPNEMAIAEGELYNLRKSNPHLNLKPFQDADDSQKCQTGTSDEPKPNVAEDIAAETGSSVRTVKRNAKYVDALNRIGQVNPKFENDIRNGTVKLTKTTVQAIGSLEKDEDIGKAIANWRNGRDWDHGLNGQPVESGNGQQTGNGQTPAKRQPSASTTAKKSAKPATPSAIMKPLKTAIGAAGRELNKAEKVTGGECVHSRKVRKLLDDALAYVAETWQKDI